MSVILLVIILILVVGGFAVMLMMLNKPRSNPEALLNQLLEKNEEQRLRQKGEMDDSVKSMLEGNQQKNRPDRAPAQRAAP